MMILSYLQMPQYLSNYSTSNPSSNYGHGLVTENIDNIQTIWQEYRKQKLNKPVKKINLQAAKLEAAKALSVHDKEWRKQCNVKHAAVTKNSDQNSIQLSQGAKQCCQKSKCYLSLVNHLIRQIAVKRTHLKL